MDCDAGCRGFKPRQSPHFDPFVFIYGTRLSPIIAIGVIWGSIIIYMVEIFRDQSPVIVGHYKSILEQAGILCLIKNETLALTEVQIPVFYPALHVMNDCDAEKAFEILKVYREAEDSALLKEDVDCLSCGEPNPANFDSCWSCGANLQVG